MATDLSRSAAPEDGSSPASWSARDTTPRAVAGALIRLASERAGRRELAYAPARALNLVTVAERGARDELVTRIERLGGMQPSRTIVCVVDDRRLELDAWATMDYDLPARPGALAVCRERVEMALGPRHLAQLESILDPLLVGDVPTIVWAPRHPQAVASLADEAHVALVDSGEEPDPAAAVRRSAGLAGEMHVVDLAWHRTTPWRERLAAAFHPPAERASLGQIDAVTVRHEPGAAASGLLLSGWLCSRLGWRGGKRFARDPEGALIGWASGAAGAVELRLEPAAGQRAPGLAGVTVTGGGASLSLDRGPGGLAVRQRDGQGRERSWVALGASRGEAGILADALRDALTCDTAYSPALRAAAAMLG